ASTTTLVAPRADLSVSSTASSGTVPINRNVTYTVTVRNQGPSPATGVILNDTLPTGFAFVSATDSLGKTLTVADGKLVDNIGTLASGAGVTLTIVVTAPSGPGQWFNTASVSGKETDNDSSNNTSLLASNVIPSSDLSVTLSADQARVT